MAPPRARAWEGHLCRCRSDPNEGPLQDMPEIIPSSSIASFGLVRLSTPAGWKLTGFHNLLTLIRAAKLETLSSSVSNMRTMMRLMDDLPALARAVQTWRPVKVGVASSPHPCLSQLLCIVLQVELCVGYMPRAVAEVYTQFTVTRPLAKATVNRIETNAEMCNQFFFVGDRAWRRVH